MKAKYINPYTDIFSEEIFLQGFKRAEIAGFDEKQLAEYEESLKVYRYLKGVIDTSYEEGKTEGKMEGKLEIAEAMKTSGESPDRIVKFTGLSKEEIDRI